MRTSDYQTWIELSKSAYFHNISLFRKTILPETELKLAVKANAYGHGLQQIVSMAGEAGIYSFAVHSLTEAMQIKNQAADAKILILGPLLGSELDTAVKNRFHLALFNIQHLHILDQISRKEKIDINLHLKVETGTNRLGILSNQVPDFIDIIQKNPFLILSGLYTHYANIEDTTDHSFAMNQLNEFKSIKQEIISRGINQFQSHTACSAAILLFTETHMDMVRLGLSQYGLWSSKETYVSYKIQHAQNNPDILQPVLTFKTRIGQIKTIRHGDSVGYGCTYKVTRDSCIAVLPVGYYDGINRKISNSGYFLINGQRAPIRGRVCMNLTMVDITDIPGVKLEDEVVLIGNSGSDSVTVEDWANWIGTINYEVITQINSAIPRIII